MTTVFISGHRDLTRAEFDLHYLPRLRQAVEQGCDFVVGDAPGCDALAQAYLRACGSQSVIVYYRGRWPRNNIGRWPTRGVDAS